MWEGATPKGTALGGLIAFFFAWPWLILGIPWGLVACGLFVSFGGYMGTVLFTTRWFEGKGA